LVIQIRSQSLFHAGQSAGDSSHVIRVPISLQHKRGETKLVISDGNDSTSQPDSALIKAIARGYAWFEDLASAQIATTTDIAKYEGVTDRYVACLLRLAS
jgi:site-specific DNA recombinase